MPLNKVTSTILAAVDIAGEERSALSSAIDMENAVQLAITVSVLFGAGAASPSILEVYASPDNSAYDSVPFFTGTIPEKLDGGTVQASFDIPSSIQWAKAKVYNSDTQQVDDVSIVATVQNAG